MPTKGALPLFRLAGIRVYLHFTWFIVAALDVTRFADRYHNAFWAVLEYLALFGIVLLHEFGHALACRQTGGQADTIVLWPLGGIAFVKPPPRPGAYLWSIAAGPLVNVILLSFLIFVALTVAHFHGRTVHPDLYKFVVTISFINGVLLFFNLIPVYPLDGGQILRGLLWLKVGPIRSLKASKHNWLRRSNSLCPLGDRVARHVVRHNRVFHFRGGTSRLARCSEPHCRIRGGCWPPRRTFSAADSGATTLNLAISQFFIG
jgi:Zn-dependent protease